MAAIAAAPWLSAFVALAAVLALLRLWRHGAGRVRWLALLQPVLAAALLAFLLQPAPPVRGTLLVLSGGAAAPTWNGPAVALPAAGAEHAGEATRVPDLATALRRWPEVDAVHVVGRGLAPHDREAVGPRALSFASPAASNEPAFVALQPPLDARVGAPWRVHGRVRGAAGSIELFDPAGTRIAQATADDEGRFALTGFSRGEGPAMFRLRLSQGERTLAETPLPVAAHTVPAPRVLLLAAVPSPELKFLRRWAVAAGIDLDARIVLAPTLVQRRGAPSLDAATLAEYDLVIADERSWPWLSAHRRVLETALGEGLGLLLRVGGPVPAPTLQEWDALGLVLRRAGEAPRAATLAEGDAALHAWPLEWTGPPARHPWRDRAGEPLAAWRPYRLGRVGVAWLADSFRLHLRGTPQRHGAMWAELVGELARARGAAPPERREAARIHRRTSWCGLDGTARIESPDGKSLPLSIERGCAAFWPRQPGWHRLLARGAGGMEERVDWFHVAAPRRDRVRRDESDRHATQALVNRAAVQARPPASPWRDAAPALLVLALLASCWWLERRLRAPR